ncbi:hypothetical protein BOTCAL_0140g00040 [Botryotinia calthae]|uniref:Cyanovirin-N domain-containing protein n=1 Tax=Botryotinia calthae TaxID=38488 RepID=A0A4Y8D3L5_9HELO|nr:hypothetical protein BOTCAL_0140g00040 [Botryotinia calthae]
MRLQRLFLLGFAAGTSAIPARHVLSDRDNGICSAENMKVDVSDYKCPKKNTLDSKGYCSKPILNVPDKEGCSAYCEIRLTLSTGKKCLCQERHVGVEPNVPSALPKPLATSTHSQSMQA